MKFKVGDKVLLNDNNEINGVVVDVRYNELFNKFSYLVGVEEYSDLYNETWTRETTYKECELDFAEDVKPTINDLRDYMLEHFVDENGILAIKGLDFSEFDGTVAITGMKVKNDLYQGYHTVGGHLSQTTHTVGGTLFQSHHKVGGNLLQGQQEVGSDYKCISVKYGGKLFVDEPQKTLKELTVEELAQLGYKLKEE